VCDCDFLSTIHGCLTIIGLALSQAASSFVRPRKPKSIKDPNSTPQVPKHPPKTSKKAPLQTSLTDQRQPQREQQDQRKSQSMLRLRETQQQQIQSDQQQPTNSWAITADDGNVQIAIQPKLQQPQQQPHQQQQQSQQQQPQQQQPQQQQQQQPQQQQQQIALPKQQSTALLPVKQPRVPKVSVDQSGSETATLVRNTFAQYHKHAAEIISVLTQRAMNLKSMVIIACF
jgi:hypothetical protein